MKALSERFESRGFWHQLEARDGNIAIYRRWKHEHHPHWETIVVRVAPASKFSVDEPKTGTIREIIREEQEIYPSAEQFGKFGFTHGSLEEAKRKMAELLSTVK